MHMSAPQFILHNLSYCRNLGRDVYQLDILPILPSSLSTCSLRPGPPPLANISISPLDLP